MAYLAKMPDLARCGAEMPAGEGQTSRVASLHLLAFLSFALSALFLLVCPRQVGRGSNF